MNRTYVALDLETTGLDSKRDTIMEVGAVRFRDILNDGIIRPGRWTRGLAWSTPGGPSPSRSSN